MSGKQKIRKLRKIEEIEAKRQERKQRVGRRFWGITWKITKYTGVLALIGGVLFGGKYAVSRFSTQAKKDGQTKGSKTEVNKEVTATIETAKGKIVIGFYPKEAPKTVENFILLTQRKYYDGTKFHRVEPGFVIQGGDPLSKDKDPKNDGTGGESAWGGKFKDEINEKSAIYKTGYMQGVVAMANSGANTNGSQFFIMLKDNKTLPKSYTIFGKIITGMDIVKKIKKGDVMKRVLIIEKNKKATKTTTIKTGEKK